MDRVYTLSFFFYGDLLYVILKKIVFYTSRIKWLQFFNMMIPNNIGGNNDKAKASYAVLKRIESINSGIFQFPTEEDNLIAKERKVVEEKMKNIG